VTGRPNSLRWLDDRHPTDRQTLTYIAQLEAELALVKAQRDALKGALWYALTNRLQHMCVNLDQYQDQVKNYIQSIIDNAKP
jgi:hypothetical protein